jgi:ATP-dependent Clp protease ATP-binding subunit ClpC
MQKNKFTKNAIAAIDYANRVCLNLKISEMALDHLFMGILAIKEGVGSKVLARLDVDPDSTVKSIEEELKNKYAFNPDLGLDKLDASAEIAEVTISPDIKKVFQKAFDQAISSGHSYIGTEHLLLGLMSIKDSYFVKELAVHGIDYKKVKEELESFAQYPDYTGQSLEKPAPFAPTTPNQSAEPKANTNNFFESFGRNLTNEARQGKLDPVIGRDKEILRVMQVLSRRTKNNPILLGDAGVGKTAIVEGLAQKIANGDVSPVLAAYEIWSIDTASIVAGSQLRGDIESKILDMIEEIEQRGNVILFIDEIHTILGAGATSNNPLDIGNILKPALARGILHCVGATTAGEYRKHFDEDPALQRRFQPVDVDELSEEDTLKVLKRLKPVYEGFHGVKISNEALKAAIKLSKRYITDRFLPDKAIDIIDEACSKNKLERVQISDEFKDKIEELKKIVEKKNISLQAKKIEEASLSLEEEKKVMKELQKMEAGMKKAWDNGEKNITEREIKGVIHSWTKIPMNSMEESISSVTVKLDKDLQKNIIGQNYASEAVVNAIKRAKAGLTGYDKPLASFLFVGPTGVGKTELAKQLAKSLFGSKESLIQVDMSELMEAHSVSKLIGSPPGYIGYDNGGQLTDKVRRRPFSVVLFDEIEKASPEVLNILLQILDEGHLTDSKGRKINFKNTIIILTSNIGAEFIKRDSVVGIYLGDTNPDGEEKKELDKAVSEARERIIGELKEYLQPEFLNRIDDIVVFKELEKEEIKKIAKLNIQNFVSRIKKDNNVSLTNADAANILNYIVETGFSEEYGAREIRRVISSTLENAVADKIVELNWNGEGKSTLNLKVDIADDNKFLIEEVSEKVKA